MACPHNSSWGGAHGSLQLSQQEAPAALSLALPPGRLQFLAGLHSAQRKRKEHRDNVYLTDLMFPAVVGRMERRL